MENIGALAILLAFCFAVYAIIAVALFFLPATTYPAQAHP